MTTSTAKNPNWTRDELILAVEFYKTYAPSIPGKTDKRLIAVSDEIRALAKSLGLEGDETFRNPNGVYMKLMELRKYDPDYKGKGLGRKLRQVEQEAWDLTATEIASATKLIRAALVEIREDASAGQVVAASWERCLSNMLSADFMRRL